MSGDWRFKYALANECSSEAQTLCQGVAAGGGRVIRCLQSKLGDPAMGAACRAAQCSMRGRDPAHQVFLQKVKAHVDESHFARGIITRAACLMP